MAIFLVRVVLADRPGALGAVASRIGSVRADVVGVEIVERGEGRAVDDFIVELADESHVALLVSEVEQVDGAAVEQVVPLTRGRRDRRRDSYEVAVALVSERSPEGLLGRLATVAARELDASWTAVVEVGVGGGSILASHGRPPAPRWLMAFAEDLRGAPDREPLPDVASASLDSWDLALVVGRPGWAYGQAERQRLAALAELADARWVDLARSAHPSRAC